jgi:peptidoglycan/xylan/chitin deacetylase (PgdA/CDA1 family)
VHESEFRNQLQLFHDLKVTVTAPEDVASGRPPIKAVALTFDDGYSSHYSIAFRLMAEFGVSGTFFLVTSRVGTGEFLDWTCRYAFRVACPQSRRAHHS